MSSPTGFVAFVPARGGSKSIPLKNVKSMCGRPLIEWVLRAIEGCEQIGRVVVSTDSPEIEKIVAGMGIRDLAVHHRSPESASDTASTEDVMLEYAREHDDFEHMVLVQATSPLLRASDLRRGLEMVTQGDHDSVLSVVRQKRFVWTATPQGAQALNYDVCARPRRQDFDGMLVENGAFYVTGREALLETGCRLSGRIGLVEMGEHSYHELDEPEDWPVVESLLSARLRRALGIEARHDTPSELARIKAVITDCDGVLTDGGMYYSETGDETKKFNTRDGMGLELLRREGILTGLITSESATLVERRARKLGIEEIHLGERDKLGVVLALCEKHSISLEEIAYIGDDVLDLPVIQAVGFGCCVRDAVEPVRKAADFVTHAAGGEGAVRELADTILAARRAQ